jgi:hypothetical protein
MRPDVCFGSLADIAAALPNVRFTPESGHQSTGARRFKDGLGRHGDFNRIL